MVPLIGGSSIAVDPAGHHDLPSRSARQLRDRAGLPEFYSPRRESARVSAHNAGRFACLGGSYGLQPRDSTLAGRPTRKTFYGQARDAVLSRAIRSSAPKGVLAYVDGAETCDKKVISCSNRGFWRLEHRKIGHTTREIYRCTPWRFLCNRKIFRARWQQCEFGSIGNASSRQNLLAETANMGSSFASNSRWHMTPRSLPNTFPAATTVWRPAEDRSRFSTTAGPAQSSFKSG